MYVCANTENLQLPLFWPKMPTVKDLIALFKGWRVYVCMDGCMRVCVYVQVPGPLEPGCVISISCEAEAPKV